MEMGSEEEKWEKLDSEFDHFVSGSGVRFGLENCVSPQEQVQG